MYSLLWALAISLCSPIHDFHVSITSGKWNSESNTLEIYTKVFRDDMEEDFKFHYGYSLQLGEPDENAKSDSLLANHFLSRFKLKSKGEDLEINYLGKELEQDILFVYLEVPLKGELKELNVSNSLFFDRFDDQSNIVNIEVRGKLESAFLKRSSPNEILRFE